MLFIVLFFFFLFFIISFSFIKIHNFVVGSGFKIKWFSSGIFFSALLINSIYMVFVYSINYIKYKRFIHLKIKNIFILNILFFTLIFSISLIILKTLFENKNLGKFPKFVILIPILVALASLFIFYEKAVPYPEHLQIKNKELKEKYLSEEKGQRIINLYIEGLSFDFIFPYVLEDKLPNFNWLMENGSWGKTSSFTPAYKLSHLTSYLTGSFPSYHHKFSVWEKSFSKISRNRIYILPEGLFFKTFEKLGLIKKIYSFPEKKYKKNVFDMFDFYKIKYLRSYFLKETKGTEQTELIKTKLPIPFENINIENDNLKSMIEKNLIYDEKRLYPLLENLNNTSDYRFLFSYMDGLLNSELYFYKYSFPEYFSDISEEEIHNLGTFLEKYYQYIDQYLGKIIINMKGDDLLIVYSSFGVRPINPVNLIINRLINKDYSSATYENSPEGVVIFYGNNIRKNYVLKNFSNLNMFPIFFYYLGLPVPKEVSKHLKLNMLKKEYIRENPLIFLSI